MSLPPAGNSFVVAARHPHSLSATLKNNPLLLSAGVALLFALITLGLYWPGFNGPFVLDDLPSLQPAFMETFSWRKLLEISFQNGSGPLGRPIAISTFALNSIFFGTDPFSFKLINFILHLLMGLQVGILIYFLMIWPPQTKKYAPIVASLTAFLWLIHPLQVSTVLYVVQRMTQLCHLFILLGLNTYLWGRLRWCLGQRFAFPLMAVSLGVFFPLALFSKETAILFPGYVLAIEYFILNFQCPHLQQKAALKRFQLALNLGVLISLIGYYIYSLPPFLSFFAEKNSSPLERGFTELKILVLYLKMILLPQLSHLGFYHDDYPLSSPWDLTTLAAGLLIAVLISLVFFLRKKAPIIAFGLAWFFISHTIESTVFPLELLFEHRNYLASVGLFWIAAYYGVIFFEKASDPLRYFLWAGALGIFLLISSITYEYSKAWSSSDDLLALAIRYHPASARVHIEQANKSLARLDYQNAFNELDQAQTLEPHNLGIKLHKVLIYCHSQTFPQAFYDDALAHIQQNAITPYAIMVLDTLVLNAFHDHCAVIGSDKMVALLHKAHQNPFLNYRARYKATLYQLEAALQLHQHQVDKGLTLLTLAFNTYPKSLDPLIQKAFIEIQKGRMHDAQKTFKLIQTHAHSFSAPADKIQQLTQRLAQEKTEQLKEDL